MRRDTGGKPPLFQVLSERYGTGTPDRRVFVYAAGGYYYPGKNVEALKREMLGYIDRGYSVVKMKIGGASGASLKEDLERIEAVLQVLPKQNKLAVDANGRFDLPTAIAYGEALAAMTSSGTKNPATHWTTSYRRT